ncbi:MAG: hypothetical protein CMI13_00950 [Oleibacter sp.]|nr:hypothetical protein [Thalassolituus sp.]
MSRMTAGSTPLAGSKIFTTTGIFLACCWLLLIAQCVQADKIRYSAMTPPEHVWTQVLERFSADLKKSSTNSIVMRESRFAKSFGEANILNMLKTDQLQVGVVAVASLTTLDPSLNGWLVPYAFGSTAEMVKAGQSSEASAMLDDLEKHNLIALGYVFPGMRQMLSVAPIKSVADLKGRRIGTFENDMFYNWYRQLGIDPQPTQFMDALARLQNGDIDAIDCDLATAYGLHLYQAAGNLVLTNHMAFPGVLVVSREWWGKLNARQQTLVRESAQRSIQWGHQQVAQLEKQALKQLRSEGVRVMTAGAGDFGEVPTKLRDFYAATNARLGRFAAAL